jgi:hypothetical protein
MNTLAILFREVLKSAYPRVLAVVANYRRLAESSSLLCFTDTRVLFLADWKYVVTVVFVSTAALFALVRNPITTATKVRNASHVPKGKSK